MERAITQTAANMQFKQGTHVYTSENQDAGTIDRVVLDPQNDEVVGLVVRKGWLFTEDKVVPISMVASATEDRVSLHHSEATLDDLPEFEASYYVPATEDDYRDDTVIRSTPYAAPLYNYPPVGTAWWGFGAYVDYPPIVPEQDYVQRVQSNIPEGTVAVKEGARVVSQDGKHVGNVEEIFTDAATNRVTHLVISQGLVFKDRKLIPSNWVKEAGEEEIVLTVNTNLVNSLPEYER